MSPTLAWAFVGLGLVVVVVRRRSLAVGLVTVQSLVLVGLAGQSAEGPYELVAAAALAARCVGLAALLLVLIRRTREPAPVRAGLGPLWRGGLALALALALAWLVPPLAGPGPGGERAALALVAFGLVAAATRRATLFGVLAVILVENGLVLAALGLPGTSWLIEIGVAVDLVLIALVAGALHLRIFSEFGAGDAGALRSLRD
jgi:hydrogenase-4 component E